jgi:hypothetical protein
MIQNSGGVNAGLYQLSISPSFVRALGDFNDGAVLFSVDGQPGLMITSDCCLGGSLEMVRDLNCERLGHKVTSPFRSRVDNFAYFSGRSGLEWHLSSQERNILKLSADFHRLRLVRAREANVGERRLPKIWNPDVGPSRFAALSAPH